jgi:hypothetical protein
MHVGEGEYNYNDKQVIDCVEEKRLMNFVRFDSEIQILNIELHLPITTA